MTHHFRDTTYEPGNQPDKLVAKIKLYADQIGTDPGATIDDDDAELIAIFGAREDRIRQHAESLAEQIMVNVNRLLSLIEVK